MKRMILWRVPSASRTSLDDGTSRFPTIAPHNPVVELQVVAAADQLQELDEGGFRVVAFPGVLQVKSPPRVHSLYHPDKAQDPGARLESVGHGLAVGRVGSDAEVLVKVEDCAGAG
jgi:hypothetical protein